MVTRLRSRGESAGSSQTSPNKVLSVIAARWGAMSPKDCLAFVGSSFMFASPFQGPEARGLGRPVPFGSDLEQRLDRAPLVHCAVTFGDFGERQFEIEDLAGLDLALQHAVHEIGEEAPHGRRPAQHALLAVEELPPVESDAVGNADITDRSAGSRASERLR